MKDILIKLREDNRYTHTASPAPAYGNSKSTAKKTIQNSSLDEFATMLFSVAANLKTENKLSTEEKIAQFEVYAKLATSPLSHHQPNNEYL